AESLRGVAPLVTMIVARAARSPFERSSTISSYKSSAILKNYHSNDVHEYELWIIGSAESPRALYFSPVARIKRLPMMDYTSRLPADLVS
ncbi:MAG: hypothetical protein H6Q07_1175, partial [Acidobacteria bacterium]|nr:hypothetical protein [Acidobacteriota bacterium]